MVLVFIKGSGMGSDIGLSMALDMGPGMALDMGSDMVLDMRLDMGLGMGLDMGLDMGKSLLPLAFFVRRRQTLLLHLFIITNNTLES